MADEEFYLQVENELKEGTKDEALWSKAKHLAKADEDAWKGYISYGYAPELYLSALKKPKDGKVSR